MRLRNIFVVLVSLVVCLFSTLGCAKESAKHPPLRTVTSTEAQQMMQTDKNYLIVDVRTLKEYNESHIPAAINIPNEMIRETVQIKKLPDKNQLIFVYCRSGRRSAEAAQKLVRMGYTNVVDFGGLLDWTGALESKNQE